MEKDSSIFENKYPKTKNNNQCLGPCYHAKTHVIHPVTLEYVTDNLNSFCPIAVQTQTDPKTGKQITKLTDTCFKPTESTSITGKELEMNMILPNINFDCEHFLTIYYDIKTFEQAVEWITEKTTSSLINRQRILDCAWNKYARDIDIVDMRVIDFYLELCMKKWIKDMYGKLNGYITVINDNIFLVHPNENKLTSRDYIVNRTNYMIDKFVNKDTIQKFFVMVMSNKKRHDLWDKYNSVSDQFKIDYINYIEKKINKTLNKEKEQNMNTESLDTD